MTDITVIIPVIEAHYTVLQRAVQSIRDSTLAANILIVNDGLGTIEANDAKIIQTRGHAGSAHSRNVGIDACDTPLVFFLDADDYLVPNALELLYKAYLEYPEACYIYGDWFQYGKNGDMKLHLAKAYDRVRLIQHTIHTVNILIGKQALLAVNKFDESFPAWEDYDLFIRLALNGYCGVRIPYPIIVYDMLLGVNREQHDIIGEELHPQVIAKYKSYKGEQDFMPCNTCGGNDRQNAQRNAMSTQTIPPDQNGLVTLEFTGINIAPIRFMVDDGTGKYYYRGANDNSNKYIQVPPHHAKSLIERGVWRRVVQTTTPSLIPMPQDFEEWRRKNTENRERNERARALAQSIPPTGETPVAS